MNILMVVSNPFTHDSRVYNEAKTLVDAGNNVVVYGWDKKNKNPGFEIKNGIHVYRFFNNRLMNMFDYNWFQMYMWWNLAVKEILSINHVNGFDVVHCHDLSSLPIGIKLRKKLGIPIIYDSHEFWAYMISHVLPGFFMNMALHKEKTWVKKVKHIIVVNDKMKNYFENMCNKPITVVMNCKPLYCKKYKPTDNKRFTVLYLGKLDKRRFLLELINVVRSLPDVHCIIGGQGEPVYEELLRYMCSYVGNVDFVGLIPMEDVIPLTQKADAVVCMTSPLGVSCSNALANKQFEAMVSGRPIICTSGTYLGEFTKKYDVGITVEYDHSELKKGIEELMYNPDLCYKLGVNAFSLGLHRFNWELESEKLLDVYNGLMDDVI